MKLALLMLALTCCALELHQVSGSYYGEVGKRLLSTMQSLSSGAAAGDVTGSTSTTEPAANQNQETSTREETQNVTTTEATSKTQEPEPNKNEFVKLDTALDLSTSAQEATSTQQVLAAEESTSVSASTATDSDPTTTTEQQAVEVVTSGAAETTAPPETATSSGSNDPPAPELGGQQLETNESSKQPEEAVREIEQEAVAAVDASIGFGNDPFGSLTDACYDEYGNARFCEPPFENAAFERQVEVSSECGSPPSRFCTAHASQQVRQCHICDAQHPKKRHPAAYLTDMNNSNSPTCWVSGPISSPMTTTTTTNTTDSNQPLKSDNVTLTLNLDKKYEIIYISMQFCSVKPDSLAIYKSADGGRSWAPYQFYSSQCRKMYGKVPQTSSRLAELEAQCSNSSAGGSSTRIAFSTLEGRAGAHSVDKSAQLQDWMSASQIKIVLDRHQPSWAHYATRASNSTDSANQENSLTSPSDSFNYAVSDLTVGGRCKCNGHASRCVHSKEGRLQCDCRHNTAGRDCERCAPFHFDRPWARATQLDANPCQPCNCNGHSRKCRFDPELYRRSGKRSGGVCTACRDNTTGRHCQYCRQGFTRDHSKSMSDKEACKHCDCHPIGSLGPICDPNSGQCHCKEGVTGLQCNRCSPGYQQSSSPDEPCTKLPENDINYEPSLVAVGGDEQPAAVAGAADSQSSAEIATEEPRPTPPAGRRESAEAAASEADENAADELDDVTRRPRPPAHPAWPAQSHRRRRPPSMVHLPARHSFDDQEQPMGRARGNSPQLDNSLDELDDGYHTALYKNPFGSYPARGYLPDYRAAHQTPYGVHVRHKPLMKPALVGVDHGDVEGYAFADDDSAGYSQQMGAMYGEAAFNQIQAAAAYPMSGRRRLGKPGLKYRQSQYTCADCQASTRRLSFRQFCHLDYAIKANIFGSDMADDWTRFDVEIQDIFKSPSVTNVNSATGNYLDNILADEPAERGISSSNQTSNSDEASERHLRVGTKRSIWLPTEDLACKCPKLKTGSSYLLMGSIDAKEDSDTALQLDRHGVALEWRAGLQERLVKYQRRHSRGRCTGSQA